MMGQQEVSSVFLRFWARRITLHLITWLVVACAIRFYSVPALTKDNVEVVWHASVVIFIESIFVFYFLSYLIFPKFLYRRNLLVLILLLLMLFQAIYVLNYFEFKYLSRISYGSNGGSELYVRRVWNEYFSVNPIWACFTKFSLAYINYAWSLFYVTPVLAIKVTRDVIASRTSNLLLQRDRLQLERDNLDLQRQSLKLQRDNLNLELSFLKSQINPHFLFNTLNAIYIKTVMIDSSAADLVVKLSNLMRYSLYESNQTLVKLEQEVEYIINYIALERERFGQKVDIQFILEGSIGQLEIAPLLLISFVENAFKHGVKSAGGGTFVHITIGIEGMVLSFTVVNSLIGANAVSNISIDRRVGHKGFGISNSTKRLQLLYKDRHSLSIYQEQERFVVKLTIDLG